MDKEVQLISYRRFNSMPEVVAFTTCRDSIHGINQPRFTGADHEMTAVARHAIADILHIDAGQLVFPGQEHTNVVVEVDSVGYNRHDPADALITNKQGICLCIQTADCVPVIFYDPEKRVIAVAHAGWRGTSSLIVREVLNRFFRRYSSSPQNILTVMGPAISVSAYEVGAEVAEAIRRNIPNAGLAIKKEDGGKYRIDLHEANKQVMLDCGILPENIDASDYCTFADNHLFFSARREGIATGRIVTGIMLNH